MSNEQNVPALRFPEFGEVLKPEKLGDVATFSKGRGISKSDIEEGGAIPCVRYGELYTTYGEIIDEIESYTNLDPADLVISEPHDVIVPASGETQIDIATASCVLKGGVAISGDLNIVKSPINGIFLAYYLGSAKKYEIASMAQGNSVVHLYAKQLKTLQLNLPSPPEQHKIATFLAAVDERLRLLEAQREELLRYKEGVMQRIFDQELRFKDTDGKDFPEWDEKRVGEVFDFHRTNSYSRAKLSYEEGEIFNIHYGDIHSKYGSSFFLDRKLTPRIRSKEDTSKIDVSSFCQEGDLIVADASEDYKDVGKVVEVIQIGDAKVVAGLHTFLLRQNGNVIVKGFGRYLFQSKIIRSQIMRMATGTSVLGISKTNMAKVKMPVPEEREQDKIIGILEELDSKLESLRNTIDAGKSWKQGLLQNLFA